MKKIISIMALAVTLFTQSNADDKMYKGIIVTVPIEGAKALLNKDFTTLSY